MARLPGWTACKKATGGNTEGQMPSTDFRRNRCSSTLRCLSRNPRRIVDQQGNGRHGEEISCGSRTNRHSVQFRTNMSFPLLDDDWCVILSDIHCGGWRRYDVGSEISHVPPGPSRRNAIC